MNIDKKIGIVLSIIGIGLLLAHIKNADFDVLLLFLVAIMIIIIVTNTYRIRKLEKAMDNLKEES